MNPGVAVFVCSALFFPYMVFTEDLVRTQVQYVTYIQFLLTVCS